MKTRNRFVSNSSSTSFCIIGICEYEDKFKEKYPDVDNIYNLDDYSLGLEGFVQDYGPVYYGLNIFFIEDDETMGEFKERARKALSKKLNQELSIDDMQLLVKGWYDE